MNQSNPNQPTTAKSKKAVVFFICLALGLLIADLVIKHYAFIHVAGTPVDVVGAVDGSSPIPPHDRITVISNVLALKLTLNQGAVFGIGQGKQLLFIVFTVIAVGVIGYMYYASPRKDYVFHVVLAMILAGAIGNLYDRIAFNAVRDMFWLFPDVHLPFGWRWPGTRSTELYPWIFNAADVYLVFGIGIMMIRIIFTKPEETNSNAENPQSVPRSS